MCSPQGIGAAHGPQTPPRVLLPPITLVASDQATPPSPGFYFLPPSLEVKQIRARGWKSVAHSAEEKSELPTLQELLMPWSWESESVLLVLHVQWEKAELRQLHIWWRTAGILRLYVQWRKAGLPRLHAQQGQCQRSVVVIGTQCRKCR